MISVNLPGIFTPTREMALHHLFDKQMKWEGLMRAGIRMKMRVPTMAHVINNTLYITRKDDLLDVVWWQQGMNEEFLHSDLVDQDVLLLGGEKDAFQPPVLFHKQSTYPKLKNLS